ncbi:hypothetical protein PENNAL_c0439G01808 [Penicillium nalgiovense]|uniref:Uncharacterized protein n=1 Tax=Penicillium nalgiovense TaxID=60175 RepID=A0A1V6VXA9_PENNA|nr:hypothetical protein PENNAL_c0439G01808 [Penicillium nalgiovense]
MTFSIFLLLTSVYIRAALGGSLTVIDYDRQCVIWSDDNYGCTGHSSSFGLLDGDDCSDLSMITHGIRKDYSKLDVGVCGSAKDNILPVAWIGWKLVYCFRLVFINLFIDIFIGIFIGIYNFHIGFVFIRIIFMGIASIVHFCIIY